MCSDAVMAALRRKIDGQAVNFELRKWFLEKSSDDIQIISLINDFDVTVGECEEMELQDPDQVNDAVISLAHTLIRLKAESGL